MRALVLAAAFATVFASGARAEFPGLKREATPVFAPGLSNFWRVAPNIYRSAQPDAQGFAEAARRYGVKTVVSLRDDFDDRHFGAQGVRLVRAPMDAMNLPAGAPQVVRALRAIRLASREGGVLVHCQHGADRTGAVVALYRMIYQGWSRERAITEMIDGPFDFHNVFIFAPPGRSIRDYVASVDVRALRRAVGVD